MNVYVLDQSFNVVDLIDDYESIIWRPAYYDVGDFELYLNATPKVIALLKKDYYLVRDIDILIDEDNKITYRNVMIIKNFKLTTNTEEGDHYTVTGRELKYLLNQRIVWTQTNLTGTAENGIRQLVTENAIEPIDGRRKIPNLILGASAGLTDTISKQVTGGQLDDAIREICITYNYGWEVYIYDGNIVFIVYQGVNRSYNQTERPYVVFSDDFDNIHNSEYELNTESYANMALIAGEGEGTQRIHDSIGIYLTGLERFETYVDARDISQNKDSEDEISLEDYKILLQERGKEKIAELAFTEGFTGEVLANVNFIYGIDYYMGDTVTVINKYGISKNVMVLSVIESADENGTNLIPQFNI